VKKQRAVPEDRLDGEMPRKRVWTEVPAVCRPSVIIETMPVEWLLWELLACNLRIVRAAEDKVEVLREATQGFRELAAIWAKYLEQNGVEEQGSGNGAGEEQRRRETKEMEMDVHTEEGNRAEVTGETEMEEQMEGKGKEKVTDGEIPGRS